LAVFGFLLVLFATSGWPPGKIPQFKLATARTIVAGVAIAVGGMLLVAAGHRDPAHGRSSRR